MGIGRGHVRGRYNVDWHKALACSSLWCNYYEFVIDIRNKPPNRIPIMAFPLVRELPGELLESFLETFPGNFLGNGGRSRASCHCCEYL